MATVIESSLWVDFFHPKTLKPVREQVRSHLMHSDAVLCEPVIFELLRYAPKNQRENINAHFITFPVLSTPPSLWRAAQTLGQLCHNQGWVMGSMDLLISAVCIHHEAQLVTFDTHFAAIAKVSKLRLQLLPRTG